MHVGWHATMHTCISGRASSSTALGRSATSFVNMVRINERHDSARGGEVRHATLAWAPYLAPSTAPASIHLQQCTGPGNTAMRSARRASDMRCASPSHGSARTNAHDAHAQACPGPRCAPLYCAGSGAAVELVTFFTSPAMLSALKAGLRADSSYKTQPRPQISLATPYALLCATQFHA